MTREHRIDSGENSRPPTCAYIDLQAIRHNVTAVRRCAPDAEIMAVVKADAYGHGAIAVARVALESGATRLAVAHLSEAISLREAGIASPILVFGGFLPEHLQAYDAFQLEMVLANDHYWPQLEHHAAANGRPIPVHVKFDTGMGRLGFDWRQAEAILQKISSSSFLKPVGLMSHFATADEADKAFAEEQLQRFSRVLKTARTYGLTCPAHMANSAAVLDLPTAHLDIVRPGIMLYGYYPSAETSECVALRPALRWVSRLVQVKRISAGDTVSYGATWQAKQDTVIGTVAAGYADGYLRALSGKMHVLVRGRRVPVVGRICMDMFMVDLGVNTDAEAGDEVVLLGKQGEDEIRMAEFCHALQTIPYEVTCMISRRVPRLY